MSGILAGSRNTLWLVDLFLIDIFMIFYSFYFSTAEVFTGYKSAMGLVVTYA